MEIFTGTLHLLEYIDKWIDCWKWTMQLMKNITYYKWMDYYGDGLFLVLAGLFIQTTGTLKLEDDMKTTNWQRRRPVMNYRKLWSYWAQLNSTACQKQVYQDSKKIFYNCINYTITLYYYHYVFPPRKQERPLIEPGTPVSKGALEFLFVLPPFPLPSALPISLVPL